MQATADDGGHLGILAGQRSTIWSHDAFRPLARSALYRVLFDFCAFGASSRRSSMWFPTLSPFRRLRWMCCQREQPHVHEGIAASTTSWPRAFNQLFVFCVAEQVDEHARGCITIDDPGNFTNFPCYARVLSASDLCLPFVRGRFVICSTPELRRTLSHHVNHVRLVFHAISAPTAIAPVIVYTCCYHIFFVTHLFRTHRLAPSGHFIIGGTCIASATLAARVVF